MFHRLLRLISEDQFHLIQESRIAIIGIGGVGGYALESLVRSGFQHITIFDYDIIEETNLNRQIISLQENIGNLKVDEAKRRIKQINPECQVTLKSAKLTLDLIDFRDYDFVIDACDDVPIKIAMMKYCYDLSIPFVSCMGTGNRFHPELLEIVKLKKTANDPLAKKVRSALRKEGNKYLDTMVVCSKEVPVHNVNLGTICAVPMSAGALLSSYVIQRIIKNEELI